MKSLFVFGLGYTATAIASALAKSGWSVHGTVRTGEKVKSLQALGLRAELFDNRQAVEAALAKATHLLVSVPPAERGDPVLGAYARELEGAPELYWAGYLSTIGVYGNSEGGWVDEKSPLCAVSKRALARAEAEREWTDFAAARSLALDIFRLAGIYGPGRNPIERLRRGEARRILKPGQVFNRIHVEDIVQAVAAAIGQSPPEGVRIFNVTDDEPAPAEDVILYAAQLIGMPPPPPVPFEAAKLSTKAQAFYSSNRRVRNDTMKRELGVVLRYPSFREGLLSLKDQP